MMFMNTEYVQYFEYQSDYYCVLWLLLWFIDGYCVFIQDGKQVNAIFSIDPIGMYIRIIRVINCWLIYWIFDYSFPVRS